MSLVAAVISICLASAPTVCVPHPMRLEPRACRIGTIRGEADIMGAMQPVIVTIRCER